MMIADACERMSMLFPNFLCSSFIFIYAYSDCLLLQLELPLEEFEGKLNKSKLKLVLTNGKIHG